MGTMLKETVNVDCRHSDDEDYAILSSIVDDCIQKQIDAAPAFLSKESIENWPNTSHISINDEHAIIESFREWLNRSGVTSSDSAWREADYLYASPWGMKNRLEPCLRAIREHSDDLILAYSKSISRIDIDYDMIDAPDLEHVIDGSLLENLILTEDLSPDRQTGSTGILSQKKNEIWKHIDVWYPYLLLDDNRTFIQFALALDLSITDMQMLAEADAKTVIDSITVNLKISDAIGGVDRHKLLRQVLSSPESLKRFDYALNLPHEFHTDFDEDEWDSVIAYMLADATEDELRRFCDVMKWSETNMLSVPNTLLDPSSIRDSIDLPISVVIEDALDDYDKIRPIDNHCYDYGRALEYAFSKYAGIYILAKWGRGAVL